MKIIDQLNPSKNGQKNYINMSINLIHCDIKPYIFVFSSEERVQVLRPTAYNTPISMYSPQNMVRSFTSQVNYRLPIA